MPVSFDARPAGSPGSAQSCDSPLQELLARITLLSITNSLWYFTSCFLRCSGLSYAMHLYGEAMLNIVQSARTFFPLGISFRPLLL